MDIHINRLAKGVYKVNVSGHIGAGRPQKKYVTEIVYLIEPN